MFSGPLQKDLFEGKWSLAKSCFKQNYCHACHKVCRLLSFPVLLHKFTSALWVPLTGLSWLPSRLAGGSPNSSLVNRYKEL